MQALTRRGTYDENNARTLVKQILEAALYLHQQGIIHRDLKVLSKVVLHILRRRSQRTSCWSVMMLTVWM